MHKDYISGIAAVVIGVFVFIYAATFSKGGFSVAENPAIYPRILSGIVFLLGVLLLIRTAIARKKEGTGSPKEAKETGGFPEGRPRVIKIAAALIGFVTLTWLVGYIISSLFFCFVTPLILGTTKKTAAVVSFSLTIVIYVLFFIFFKVPIPHGILLG